MKVPKDVLDRLWADLKPNVEHFCHAFVVSPGAKADPKGGRNKKEVARDSIIEAIEAIYREAIGIGANLGKDLA